MRPIFVLPILIAALAMACAGDDDDGPIATPPESDVLQLRGFDITTGAFREAVRSLFIEKDPSFCESIDGFTPAEAIDLLDATLGLQQESDVPIPGATPITDEARRSREDELGAARVTLDECLAATGGLTPAPTEAASDRTLDAPTIAAVD